MNKLNNPKFAVVVAHFTACCKASRDHSALASKALQEFGDGSGTPISGVVRDHFPAETKDALRMLARTVSSECDLAYTARPKYTRLHTIIAIGRLVATRDGSGFYGPRA